MTFFGDLHNGQAVRRVRSPDGSFWFEKPRPVYWEWLFFGKDSPVAEFFSHQEAIFGLTIEMADDLSGRSKEISSYTRKVTPQHFFRFGYLLGYAYAFGIQDLFFDNLIKTDTGLQVIDVEIVLSHFALPHESFLLPFRNYPFEKLGVAHLVQSADQLAVEQVENIMEGFCTVLEDVNRNGERIARVINADPRSSKAPVRVLLRESSDYRNWRQRSYSQPLLAEEIEQLERGDVPYFFKVMDGSELSYLLQGGERRIVSLSPNLETAVHDVGTSANSLFSVERIRKELFPRGVLYLLKKLLAPNWSGDFESPHFSVKFSKDKISLISWWGKFDTGR